MSRVCPEVHINVSCNQNWNLLEDMQFHCSAFISGSETFGHTSVTCFSCVRERRDSDGSAENCYLLCFVLMKLTAGSGKRY